MTKKSNQIVGVVACYVAKLPNYIVYYNTGSSRIFNIFTLPQTARDFMESAKFTKDEIQRGMNVKVYSMFNI